jgi:hypothetical protein
VLANKRGATRLGFAVILKFFELEARFRLVQQSGSERQRIGHQGGREGYAHAVVSAAVLFDLDGTLIDHRAAAAVALRTSLGPAPVWRTRTVEGPQCPWAT